MGKYTIYPAIVLVLALAMPGVLSLSWGQYIAKPEDVSWKSPIAVFNADKLKPGAYSKVVNNTAVIIGKAIAVTAGYFVVTVIFFMAGMLR